MPEKLFIAISSSPAVVANLLDKYADDWFEVLEFLTKLADEQGVYFDKKAVANALVVKYAPKAGEFA
jgi:hypothetical protein